MSSRVPCSTMEEGDGRGKDGSRTGRDRKEGDCIKSRKRRGESRNTGNSGKATKGSTL